MEQKKLLSIIIPTKDRYKYLRELIETIEGFNSDEIEIVIQDNTCDNSVIQYYFESHSLNTTIKYFHTKEQIPISLNCDRAVLNSCGEYVCFVGDDDSLTSSVIDAVCWMKSNNVEALRGAKVKYLWPDFLCNNQSFSGRLSFSKFSYRIKFTDTYKELCKAVRNGFQGLGAMAGLYQGIVKRTALDKIYNIGGTYFPGASPDMASAVSLSLLNICYAVIDAPLIITGECKGVGGGARELKYRLAKIEKISFLPPNTAQDWTPQIPKIWAGETIWPESAIKALEYMNEARLIETVNFERIYTRFATFHPKYRNLAKALTKNKICFELRVFCATARRYLRALNRRFWTKIFHKEFTQTTFNDVKTTSEAVRKLELYSAPTKKLFVNYKKNH